MTRDLSSLPDRYDGNTILLHWVTAILVAWLFLSAEFWDFFPKSLKHFLILAHMSLGVLLAAVLLIRIVWRLGFGSRIAAAAPTVLDRAARALHGLLYVLLAGQMPLGILTQWTRNRPLDVFGVLVASPIGPCAKATGHLVHRLHDYDAWLIMVLAGMHAAAALAHHFLWRDEVLRRMVPGPRQGRS